MSESAPIPHNEQPKELPVSAYSEMLKAFTDKIFQEEVGNGTPKELKIPIDAKLVQKRLKESESLSEMLTYPDDGKPDFSKGFTATHVRLSLIGSDSDRDIVPAKSGNGKEVVQAPSWKREVGIRLGGYTTGGQNAVQRISLSVASGRKDKPWLRSSITIRHSDDLKKKGKVEANATQVRHFLELAKELYGEYEQKKGLPPSGDIWLA